MKTLDRYIVREFLRSLLLFLVAFLILSVIVDFFEKIRMFLSNDASLQQMLRYFLFALPMLISIIAPAAFLIATLTTFGALSTNHEITAMKANGISVYRIAAPIVAVAVAFSMLFFLFTEFVTPKANENIDRIIRVEIQKQQPLGAFTQNEIWYRGKAGIYNFRIFEPLSNTIWGVTVNEFDDGFNLTRRLDAQRAVWQDGRWHFYGLMITRFNLGESPVIEHQEEGIIALPEKPEDFLTLQKSADKMGYFELKQYIDKIRGEGYDATSYVADWHGKPAFSFVSILLALIGVAFSLKTERSGALARSVGTGIVVGFSYWIIFAFSMSLGRSGTIPPLLGAWLANMIFGLFALYLLSRVKT